MTGLSSVLRYIRQAPIFFMFLAVGAVLFAIDYDRIATEWRAMYPLDAEKLAALQLCYTENHQFNRMNDLAREACYQRWLPRLASR